MTNTATVEVLTAEVRVLMVGSRQVTLSVARQLDDVDPGDITPFGRIMTGRKGSNSREQIIEAIGSMDGVLVRSCVTRESLRCQAGRYDEEWGYMACGNQEQHPPHRWLLYYIDEEMWEEWRALPLIVLAGLK